MKGWSNFSTKLVYQAILLKLVLTLYRHKYYKFMRIDAAIRNSNFLHTEVDNLNKMLFPVYFFNDCTMNIPNQDKPEPNRNKAKILDLRFGIWDLIKL